MNETGKKIVFCACIAALLVIAGYWTCGVSDHGNPTGGADTSIQRAQDAADDAARANREAQDTAGTIGDLNENIRDAISRGEQLLERIRRQEQTD